MRCPSCHAKCFSDALSCGGCGAILPQSCLREMRPLSRLAYRICRSGRELLAVLCLCLLVFTGAALTLSCAAAVYEPLTAAAGLDALSLHTTDDSELTDEPEAILRKEKSAQARALAANYAAASVFGALLFSASLLLLVRIFFVSARLRNAPKPAAASVDDDLPAVCAAELSSGEDEPTATPENQAKG